VRFRAKKTPCSHGHTHDSRIEAIRCDELHELEALGEIDDLEVWPQYWFVINGRQVKHDNGRRLGYKADFRYTKNGQEIVEDTKPNNRAAISRDWPIRKAVFRALFPTIELREVTKTG
jgi:hypothetical protein